MKSDIAWIFKEIILVILSAWFIIPKVLRYIFIISTIPIFIGIMIYVGAFTDDGLLSGIGLFGSSIATGISILFAIYYCEDDSEKDLILWYERNK